MGLDWGTGENTFSMMCIGAYLPFDGEPDIENALRAFTERGQRVGLPVIAAPDNSMAFHPWQPGAAMTRSSYGIPEPQVLIGAPPLRPDVMLIPLVAWDSTGARLGVGGGYYDRYMATQQASERATRIGIAWAVQQVEKLPMEPHDMRLDALVSENGWTNFSA